ncbi:MAG TPA: hypothetical protein H9814_05200 [Candidatus Bacteroides merdigallinarum]|uniref:Anti-sigma factor n=1 Tax=Candidatus Bacteroides merdigallinarum TaxID=2838473 RepID=A0A9D2J1M4_9BACE|nr:hypothetical protein [Candidatus Bacteroides merdigallinarum]
MKEEEIERLLARYYDGQTTEQEEESLHQAFLSADELPGELQAERALFLSLHTKSQENVVVPDDLETELTALIDRKASASRRRRLWWGSVAASLLLLIGLGWGIVEIRQENWMATPQDTFTDPEDAHRALQAIFAEMSRNWNAGMEQLEASQQDIVAVNQEIKNEFKQ